MYGSWELGYGEGAMSLKSTAGGSLWRNRLVVALSSSVIVIVDLMPFSLRFLPRVSQTL